MMFAAVEAASFISENLLVRTGNPNASPSLTNEDLPIQFYRVFILYSFNLFPFYPQCTFYIGCWQNEHMLAHSNQNTPECCERQW